MQTFFSEDQLRHAPTLENYRGQLVAPFESTVRAEAVLAAVQRARLGPVTAPPPPDLSVARQVHDVGLLEFLSTCWERWSEAGESGDILPHTWPPRRMPTARIPDDLSGQLGHYAFAADTGISAGSWTAALASMATAQAATDAVLTGAQSAFGLCRPPGHHAARDQFGGYCLINNVAVAAQQARNAGRSRVAILDVDFHHGNGTQDIFYARDDVLFLSLHGDPRTAFPYFFGYAEETGSGQGEGFNVNYPLPAGTTYAAWSAALDACLARIAGFAPELLLVSLGVDTFQNDPVSAFQLTQPDFIDCGARIAGAGLDTVFIMEGGYAVDELGGNVVNVLQGFLGASSP